MHCPNADITSTVAWDSEQSSPTPADNEKQDTAGKTPQGKDDVEEAREEFQPIRDTTRTLSHESRNPVIQHSRSVDDGNGCFGFDDDQRSSQGAAPEATVDERAFEVQCDGEKDPANPRSMASLRKWMIVVIVSLSSACVYVPLSSQVVESGRLSRCRRGWMTTGSASTCTSSMYTSTYGQITKEFRCSQMVATLGLSLFVMGLGLGPMILSPLSEVPIL